MSIAQRECQTRLNIEHVVLDPSQKANHICRYWGKDLYQDALTHAEEIVSLSCVIGLITSHIHDRI